LLEGLDVNVSVGVPVEQQDGALAIQAIERQALEKVPDEPFIPCAVAARGHDFDPEDIMTKCLQTEGILQEPGPVAAALRIVQQPTAAKHNTHA
jgi:hypothetical protein